MTLAALIERVEAVLQPFADAADDLADDHADHSHIWESPAAMGVRAYDLREAKAALAALSARHGKG